jgi:hypothetical protein
MIKKIRGPPLMLNDEDNPLFGSLVKANNKGSTKPVLCGL